MLVVTELKLVHTDKCSTASQIYSSSTMSLYLFHHMVKSSPRKLCGELTFLDHDELTKLINVYPTVLCWQKSEWSSVSDDDVLFCCLCSLNTCKALVASHENIVESVESKDLKRVLYELCWAGINGQLKVDQITAALADVAVS